MSLEPILAAGLPTQIHLAAIAGAFAIGGWMMICPKGTASHKTLGRVYAVLMLVVAASSFGIKGLNNGTFSFLHLLAAFVLVMVPYAWWSARRGNIRAHRFAMMGVYFGGLWVAGIFTLLPGRLLHRAVFGS